MVVISIDGKAARMILNDEEPDDVRLFEAPYRIRLPAVGSARLDFVPLG